MCTPCHLADPPLVSPRSNSTLLEEAIGGSVDGMLSSSANPFAKSFALSAALDPGAWCAVAA